MTQRTEMQHRVAELKARLMTHIANRAFNSNTTGLDGLAKRMLANTAKPRPPGKPQRDG
ncbi:MAG: hypothetical protein VX766_11060 [Pseudomonadota bacterium]|nr:hypothetical protein [Pseudomonadota bacterium]